MALLACLHAEPDFRPFGVDECHTSVPISCSLKFKFLRAPKYVVVKHLCLVEAHKETPVSHQRGSFIMYITGIYVVNKYFYTGLWQYL